MFTCCIPEFFSFAPQTVKKKCLNAIIQNKVDFWRGLNPILANTDVDVLYFQTPSHSMWLKTHLQIVELVEYFHVQFWVFFGVQISCWQLFQHVGGVLEGIFHIFLLLHARVEFTCNADSTFQRAPRPCERSYKLEKNETGGKYRNMNCATS